MSLIGPYHYPKIDPIAFYIGSFGVHWYAFAYIIGLLLGRLYCMNIARNTNITPNQIDDFLVWCTLGVVIGGRLGQVLLYYPNYYFLHLLEIFKVWHGGMSFHGGFAGVLIAGWIYTSWYKISFLELCDIIAPAVPIGLGLGRIANFINNELWGKVTLMPWGVIFPYAGPLPRHPSQLYEAFTEGFLLFFILYILMKYYNGLKKRGYLSGVFCLGYALSRCFCEIYRAPEILQSILPSFISWGQILSIPLLLVGVMLIVRSK